MFSRVTDETGQPDQGQSDDIDIPVESQREYETGTAKATSNTLFCFHVL